MNYAIQEIFQRFYPDYLDHFTPDYQQNKVSNAMINCKTPHMGGNLSICEDCGYTEIHYNSCRNRHCPCCQGLVKEQWIDKRKSEVLNAPYFHVVFTVPAELNALIYANKTLLYNLFYQASADTLKKLAEDKKYLNTSIGFMSILHPWGQNLSFHPHIHCIVLGGGLTKNLKFRTTKDAFLFPIRVVSKLFRGKYLNQLNAFYKSGRLSFTGEAQPYRNSYTFQEFMTSLYKKEWIPHIKETFKGAENVIEYLGRYTHKIAISNARILSITEKGITFKVKDYKHAGKNGILTLKPAEFIRRFLMHVLPKGFVKIRHYGMLSNRVKKVKLTICRNLLRGGYQKSILQNLTIAEVLKKLYGINIYQCPCCQGTNRMPYHKREQIP